MRRKGKLFHMENYLLGLFAGDGWFEIRGVSFGTKDESFALKIQESLQSTYKKRTILKLRHYRDGHKLYIVSVHNKKLKERFEQKLAVTRKKSKNFIIPEFDKTEDMREFIAGMFDAEGHTRIWKNQPRAAMEIFNEKAARTDRKSTRLNSSHTT